MSLESFLLLIVIPASLGSIAYSLLCSHDVEEWAGKAVKYLWDAIMDWPEGPKE